VFSETLNSISVLAWRSAVVVGGNRRM